MIDWRKIAAIIENVEFAINVAIDARCELAKVSVGTMLSILELLKEQEPIKPVLERNKNFWECYKCPSCNKPVIYYQKYCSECGRKLEWK